MAKADKIEDKVGVEYSHMITGSPLFAGCVDGVTFGVSADGKAFDTMGSEVTSTDKVSWARANAQYFIDLANRLTMYATCVWIKPQDKE